MPIEEAADFFKAVPAIARHMQTLNDVGLGYVRLGQPAPTLSGGEAQRVKLATELQKRSTGRTVYVLDEPTTGLHFEDIRKLLGVLQGLVDKGNTVIVIEHNLDVIKSADWLVDLGPEGGSGGGRVIAEGTPEHVATLEHSHTGRFLAPVLARTARTTTRATGKARTATSRSTGAKGATAAKGAAATKATTAAKGSAGAKSPTVAKTTKAATRTARPTKTAAATTSSAAKKTATARATADKRAAS
jgi:excinuclease ABC subunit A